MTVSVLSSAQTHDIVAVFCDAFYDYPVMRHVLGPDQPYDERLRTLVGDALETWPLFRPVR